MALETPTPQSMVAIQALEQYMAQARQVQSTVQAPLAQQLGSAMLQMLMPGHTAKELQSSSSLVDQVMGHMAPTFGAYGASMLGLSPASMITAAQNMFSQGGMQVRGANGGPTIPLIGYGPTADRMTGQAWETMQNQFFNPGGSMNLRNTYGANADDLGALMQEMQRRGGFAGESAGSYERLTSDRLSSLRSGAQSSGNQALMQELSGLGAGDILVTPDPTLGTRAAAKVQEAAKTLSELRQVLGNLPVQEIFGELERLTGQDISSHGRGMQMLNSRMAGGMAAGLSSHQSLAFNSATTSTLDSLLSGMTGNPSGSFYQASAAMSGVVDRYSHAAFLEQQAAGGKRQRGEIGAAMSSDVSRLLLEAPELTEAMFGASTLAKGSAGQQRLLDSISAYGSAGTVEARMEARRRMSHSLQQEAGFRPGSLINGLGADGIWADVAARNPELIDSSTRALLGTDQAAMVGDYQRFVASSSRGYGAALGGDARAAAFMQQIHQRLSPDQRAAAMAGDLSGISGISLDGFGDAATAVAAANSRIRGATSGNFGFSDLMQHVDAQRNASPRMAGEVSAGGLSAFEKRAGEQALANMATRGQNSYGGLLQQGLHGLLGGEIPMEDQVMIDFAKGRGGKELSRYNITGDGGLDVTDGQAETMAKQFANAGAHLYAAFGLEAGNVKGLAAALKKPGGAGKAAQLLGQNPGAIAGVDKNERGGLDFVMAGDPSKLRDAYEDDIAQISGREAPKRTLRDAAASSGNSQPTQVSFTFNTPGGVQKLTGTMTSK